MTPKNQVVQVASSTETVPTLPSVILKGAQISSGREPRSERFIPLVEVDPVLTIRVLKAANESVGDLPGPIRSPAEAVRSLGLDAVRRIVLDTAVLDIFMDHRGNYGIDPVDLWMHSLGTAVFARELARALGGVDPEEAFLAGLLHDVGKLVLSTCCGDVYPGVVHHARQDGIPLHNTESGRLGYHHAEIGAWLLEPWNIPPPFADVILHHHHPSEDTLPDRRCFLLTGLVALANNLCYSQNIGSGADPAGAMLPPNMFKSLGIQRDMIKQAIQQGPLQLRDLAGRIDWEPVTRDAFHVALERAGRPKVEVETEIETAPQAAHPASAPLRDTRDLQGLNAIGIALTRCDSLESAAAAVASGLVGSFCFSRAICCAYQDDQWEYRAEAAPAEEGSVCQTELCQRSLADEVPPDAGSEGSWLHIELNGKGKVLGCVKVKPGEYHDLPLEVLGLALASCAKLAAQALERIRYQLRAQHLAENHTHEILWLKQEKEIAESERLRQENMLQCLPIGVVLLEPDGRVDFINREARNLLALDQPLGRRRLQEVIRIPGLEQAIEAALLGSNPPGRELSLPGTPGPEDRRVRWRLVPMRDGRDRPTGRLLLALGDLTAERAASVQVLTSSPLASVPKLRTGTV